MNIKKFLAVPFLILSTIMIVACGGTDSDSPDNSTPTPVSADQSRNDRLSAWLSNTSFTARILNSRLEKTSTTAEKLTSYAALNKIPGVDLSGIIEAVDAPNFEMLNLVNESFFTDALTAEPNPSDPVGTIDLAVYPDLTSAMTYGYKAISFPNYQLDGAGPTYNKLELFLPEDGIVSSNDVLDNDGNVETYTISTVIIYFTQTDGTKVLADSLIRTNFEHEATSNKEVIQNLISEFSGHLNCDQATGIGLTSTQQNNVCQSIQADLEDSTSKLRALVGTFCDVVNPNADFPVLTNKTVTTDNEEFDLYRTLSTTFNDGDNPGLEYTAEYYIPKASYTYAMGDLNISNLTMAFTYQDPRNTGTTFNGTIKCNP